RHRLLEVLLGLSREADDYVRRDSHFRVHPSQFLDEAEKLFACIAAVHPFQNPIAPALDGQMRALAKLWQALVSFDQVVPVTFRMRRSEPNALQSFDFVDRFQQLHKCRLSGLLEFTLQRVRRRNSAWQAEA